MLPVVGAAVAAVVAAAAVVGAGPAAAGSPADADRSPARRVLVFSMPFVSWADVADARTPALDHFTRRAGVAALSTKVDERATALGDGYATIGAGTRAVGAADTENGGLMPDERFGAVTAGDAYRQRTGVIPEGAIVQTGIVSVTDANQRLDYDAEVGALADALARAGIGRAVIGNADGEEPDAAFAQVDVTPGPPRQRQAVLGLMDSRGQVEEGQVDRELLEPDPRAPFGVRLDTTAVVDAFASVWSDRRVVLVEASDLVRAGRYAPYVTEAEQVRQRRAALRQADDLFAQLLAQVDLARDLVVVVGPAHAPSGITLTPLALRGPGVEPGLLRSSTTRRSGFVQIPDLAPTILAALGVDRPSSMEGRAVEVGATGGSAEDRFDFLRTEDAAAQFRDDRIGEVYAVLVVATAVILGAGLLVCWWPRARRARGVAVFLALWGVSLPISAFLVRLAPLHEAGVGAFYAAWLAIAAVVAIVGAAIGRRRPLDGLLAVLLLTVVVLTLDAWRGAPLVLNSVLGYSPTVAGRFSGFGNPAYAAYSAAALGAAALLAHRVGGRNGLVAAGGLLGAAVVVDVAPMWGADVGGILSMVPAYWVTMVLLSGRRFRPRTAAIAGAAVVAVGAVVAVADYLRPAEDRTHFGRLVVEIRANGIDEAWSMVERKLSANLASIGSSILGLVLLLAVVAAALLWRRDPALVRAVFCRVPEWRAACVGFAVLATLGFAFNDSGMTVPGIMLVVFAAASTHLLVTTDAVRADSGTVDRAPAPARRPPVGASVSGGRR